MSYINPFAQAIARWHSRYVPEGFSESDPVPTNSDYWDCSCKTAYIHPKSEGYCPICEQTYNPDAHPDSRQSEVEEYLRRKG